MTATAMSVLFQCADGHLVNIDNSHEDSDTASFDRNGLLFV